MSNTESCIIASTPFQIISAYSIADMYPDTVFDLYIIGNFKNYIEIAKNVKRTKTFRNVVTYKLTDIRIAHDSDKPLLRAICRQFSYLRFNKIGSNIVVPGTNYSDVYYAAAVSANELLLYFQNKNHPRFHLYDDGVMTYRNVDRVLGEAEHIQIIKGTICRLIGTIKPDIYVYLPELFKKMNGNSYSVNKLESISDLLKEKLCNVFGAGSEDAVEENEVIIESKVNDYLSKDAQEKLEGIYENIIVQFGKDDVVFKRHPRDSRPEISNRKYMKSTIPFELYGCIQDWNDKRIIAWDSTAVLTLKMFYDQEPTVILLYKMVKGKINNYEETNVLYSLFKETYSNSNKFIIPETIEELETYICLHNNKKRNEGCSHYRFRGF